MRENGCGRGPLLPIVFFLIAAISSAAQGDDAELIESLRSNDREQRFEGIKRVSGLKTIPVDVAAAMFDSLKLEAAFLAEPARKAKVPVEKLPAGGDEVSLARIEADPGQYVGKRFAVVGAAKIASYWNYGYGNAEQQFYSISFREPRRGGGSAHLYLNREYGGTFADQLAKNAEAGFDATAIRATVTLSESRYQGPGSWDMLEVNDIQQLTSDGKAWGIPFFAGIEQLVQELSRCEKEAVPAFVELLLQPGGTARDKAAQGLALRTLMKMNKPAKAAALIQLKKAERLSKVKEERERIRAIITVIDQSSKAQPRPARKR